MTISTHSAAETMEFGRRLAESLQPGDVLALRGDLGAGKTCLVKGIAAGLGIRHDITSPTFTLVNEYHDGRLALAHIDLYRLDTLPEALNIGIEDYLGGPGVTIIEWAERIESILPPKTKRIQLTVVDDQTRHLEIV